MILDRQAGTVAGKGSGYGTASRTSALLWTKRLRVASFRRMPIEGYVAFKNPLVVSFQQQRNVKQ